MAQLPFFRVMRAAVVLVYTAFATLAAIFITAMVGAPLPVTVACIVLTLLCMLAAFVLMVIGYATRSRVGEQMAAEIRNRRPAPHEDHGYQERFKREQRQKMAMRVEGKAVRRQLLLLRLWYLVVMPVGLITTTVLLYHVRPLWPYLAVWVASGPAAGLVALGAARRHTARVPLLRYTCVRIAYLTGTVTGILLVGEVGALIHAAFAPGWMSAARGAVTRQVVFAVLPGFLLCVALLVTVARLRQHDRVAPGGAGVIERLGFD
ncbi:MAG: hypothetical protein J2P15_00485 [Micromonosporaceae bacterium]|nr:hypothetical protein [Micromonosporaceae bacterium]